MIGDYVVQLQKRFESLLSASPAPGAAATGTASSSQQNSGRARRAGVLNPFDEGEASTNPFEVEDESTGQSQGGAVARSHSTSNSASTNPFDESVDSSTPAAVADARKAGPTFEAILSSVNQLIEFGYLEALSISLIIFIQ